MGSGRITKKVGMSPCDTDAKQTLHEYVDQAGWSMRNGRHLDTSLIESMRRARGVFPHQWQLAICVATSRQVGQTVTARSGNIPEHWPIPVSGVRLTRGAPSRRRAASRMDLFVVRVVVAADRMLVIGMGVPGEAPAVIDMAVVMAPPNHHQTDEGDLADV